MTRKDAERQEYIEKLREILKPGDVVYTTVKHVSRSGMLRMIDVHIIQDNKPKWLSYWIAKALDYPFDERYAAVRVGGCGMDMGFHLIYVLSRTLFPAGFGMPCVHCENCPATKEEAAEMIQTESFCPGHLNLTNKHAFRGRNDSISGWDPDGGYALTQKWL